jgi:hypothetical protein
MFDLCETKYISKEEINMMLINMPDMGFSNNQNVNLPDKFYLNIKDLIIQSVRQRQEEQLHFYYDACENKSAQSTKNIN